MDSQPRERSQSLWLEVQFKWKAVYQYRPVPLCVVRETWKAKHMKVALHKLVIDNPRFRFDQVQTEGKSLASLRRGWQMVSQSVRA